MLELCKLFCDKYSRKCIELSRDGEFMNHTDFWTLSEEFAKRAIEAAKLWDIERARVLSELAEEFEHRGDVYEERYLDEMLDGHPSENDNELEF